VGLAGSFLESQEKLPAVANQNKIFSLELLLFFWHLSNHHESLVHGLALGTLQAGGTKGLGNIVLK